MIERKENKVKKSDETRERILQAFSQCIVNAGYAQTKLTDIAEEAGLATPHLRYYFKNKESILEHQYERVVARFQDRVQDISAASPRAWFDAYIKLIFDAGSRSLAGRLILIEGNVLVARSSRMKAVKRKYDAHMLKTLEAQFDRAGVDDPVQSAAVTFHFLTGLILNTAFAPKARQKEETAMARSFVRQLLQTQTSAANERC